MIYMHRETGVRGEKAKELMIKFIREEQDNKWEWVATPREEPDSPQLGINSVVNDPARIPRARKGKREPSPFQLEDPDITLEEPPSKVIRCETICESDLPDHVSETSLASTEMETEHVISDNLSENEKQNTETPMKVQGEKQTTRVRQEKKLDERQKVNVKEMKVSEEKQKGEKQIKKTDKKQKESVKQKKVSDRKETENKEIENENPKRKNDDQETDNDSKCATKVNEKQTQNKENNNKENEKHNTKDCEISGDIVTTILNDMTNTYKDIITPLDDDDTYSECNTKEYECEPYNPEYPEITEQSETARAVASIVETPPIMNNIDKAADTISEKAIDYMEELIFQDITNEAAVSEVEQESIIGEALDTIIVECVTEKAKGLVQENVVDMRLEAIAEQERERRERKKQRKEEKKREKTENIKYVDNEIEGLKSLEEKRLRKEKKREKKMEKYISETANESDITKADDSEEERMLRKKSKKLRKSEKRKAKVTELKSKGRNEERKSAKGVVEGLLNDDLRMSDDSNFEPHITEQDRRAEELEKLETYIRQTHEGRVILNIGGQRFECSQLTLRKDPESKFALLCETTYRPTGNTFFFDRDPAHFRIILNYLRNDCQFATVAKLPKERRYLLELKDECKFYKIKGLEKLVDNRLAQCSEVLGLDY